MPELEPLPRAELRLHDNLSGFRGVGALADALRFDEGRLKVLMLSGNPINDDGAEALSWMIRENLGLRLVYLRGAGIGEKGAAALADALEVTKAPIEVLELGGNPSISRATMARLDALMEARLAAGASAGVGGWVSAAE